MRRLVGGGEGWEGAQLDFCFVLLILQYICFLLVYPLAELLFTYSLENLRN
jgi:hypothetical protein